MLIPARRNVPELLDRPDNPLDEHLASLEDLQGFNRNWGGTRIVLAGLERVLTGSPAPGIRHWTVLDVGTGSADIPRAIAAWGNEEGVPVRAIGFDLHPLHLQAARQGPESGPPGAAHGPPGVVLARGDALRLPFRDASVDVVMCSLFLHHFGEPEAVRLLREFRRVARRAVLVFDLRRSWLLYAGLWILTKLTARSRITVNDALVSALRAFTVPEIAALARQADMVDFRVERRWPFRWELVMAAGNR